MYVGYKHWTTEDVPRCFYVGKGKSARPFARIGRNHKWHAIVKRYGLRVEICTESVEHFAACAWEIENIKLMKTFSTNHSHDDLNDIGCNLTHGGEGAAGRQINDITRAKMSSSQHHCFLEQGVSDTTRQKLSRAFKGRIAPNRGRTVNEKTRQKMRIASSGGCNARAVLTQINVLDLRTLWMSSNEVKWKFCREHAQRLNVTPESIYNVIMNKTWKNVKLSE